ncbi:hypothetical protein NGA_0599300 [Nannochloropsis gaditana CCMP526]|uniref:uncharacterized protein n=1 Tax=Nannochloropsis gaditana (strain CCMP526) TaxID=1093141 RepID=UPI00029F6CC9|nr:hypothetical protein NGA_0599300 [Nannochloropsis gaditana CCMP526]EKU20735.1 hypothetical protein NGA_0599300 [Nannochloropsis gaditana CCMP526]|eukprot:XP_005855629.1 hypothetical protein NGA_0599300 [Nannochloropsis gaditana CCMP526]
MRSPGSKADGALPVDRPARRPSLTGGRPSSRPSSHLQDKTAESLAALDDTVSQLCRRVRGGSVSERSVPAVPKGASPSTAPVALQTGDGPPSMASTLVTVKLLFLLFYGSLGAVMPYLPVYYHSLGLPDKQIGMLGAITPAVTFVVAPLWGALADQTGRHKDVLLFTFVASVVSRLLFIWRTTFGWLAILVFCTAVLNAPVRPLLDSSVLNLLEDKREYGKQRLWGQFGFGLAGCIVGPCLMNHKFGGYKAAFYVHALISLPTLLIMRRFNPTPPAPAPSSPPLPVASTNKSEKSSMAKEEGPGAVALPSKAPSAALSSQPAKPRFREGLGIVVRNPDALIFFFLVFVIGVSSGVIENFAYKRLREVGGEGTVMGVSRFFSSVTGVPMFWFSGNVTRRLSVMGVLILSLCSYILRFFIYASITNPWQGLPAEALRGFTFAAMWASSTYYTHKISPPGLSATMLGFLNGMYGGLGQSTGALIGGGLSHRVGTPRTFVLAGLADIVVVICFGTYWWLHPNATRLKEE